MTMYICAFFFTSFFIWPCMQGFQNKVPHDASIGYLSKFGRSAAATFLRMITENK